MYRLATVSFTGKRVLIIEPETSVAASMGRAVVAEGGSVLAMVSGVELALSDLAESQSIDCVMIDVDKCCASPIAVRPLFAKMGIEVGFVASDDSWYDEDH